MFWDKLESFYYDTIYSIIMYFLYYYKTKANKKVQIKDLEKKGFA